MRPRPCDDHATLAAMTAPHRVQLSRRKGWRLPENTVVVSRPSRWGNPVVWDVKPTLDVGTGEVTPADPGEARRLAVQGFRMILADPESRAINGYPSDDEIRDELRGKNLACWCPLDHACHADVLLAIANAPLALSQPSLL